MREDPEISQTQTRNPAKQDDCPKGNLEEMPHKVIQTAARAGLSVLLCVCPHTLYSQPNKCSLAALLSVSMWKFTSTRLAGPRPSLASAPGTRRLPSSVLPTPPCLGLGQEPSPASSTATGSESSWKSMRQKPMSTDRRTVPR